jgi:hypothetical protein
MFQFVYVLGLVSLVHTAILVFGPDGLYASGDPRLVAGMLSQSLITFGIATIIGFLGIFCAWYTLKINGVRPAWFTALNKVFAWAWAVFIPIGTVIAFVLLKWNKTDRNAHAAA